MKDKLCLVLGGNGFIGSHLVDELVEAGYRVRAFDRFQNSPETKFNKSNQIEIVAGDIFDRETLKKSLKGVDFVFHCFSATTPHSSDSDPLTDIEKNLIPSVVIFQECVAQKIKKVMYLSSGGAVYGVNSKNKPASEDDVPAPVSPYGITKLGIENYLAYFDKKHGLAYIAYRLSNPYGPRQAFRNNQGVIPAFISQIRAGETLNIYGDGTASRDYIYIRDATKMIVDSFLKANKYPVYNIGSGVQTTLNDIIRDLRSTMGENFSVKFQDAPKTFLNSTSISMKRFEKEFGSLVLTDLSSGLKQTVNY